MKKTILLTAKILLNIIHVGCNLFFLGIILLCATDGPGPGAEGLPYQRKAPITVETEYGDSFTVVYIAQHVFLETNDPEYFVLKDNNSDFYIQEGLDIDENDIVGLYCESDLRIYKIICRSPANRFGEEIIYNDGGGFKIFNRFENTGSDLKVKEILEKQGEQNLCLPK